MSRPAKDARARLIAVLRSACSGELAAGHAYRGHWRSVSSPSIRERIREIEAEEWHHRELVRGLLAGLGSGPSAAREAVFWIIGKTIGMLCHIGGWFIPMYGAGRLEKWNVAEYEEAARFAREAGCTAMIDCLLTMAEVEWEHERFFREQVRGHWMLRIFPLWTAPGPKEGIRCPWHSLTASADQIGSEGGLILRDDEHQWGARITLERDTRHAPFAITCGVYGWMVHTRFQSAEALAESDFREMKISLEQILSATQDYEQTGDRVTYEKAVGAMEQLVERFP